MDIVELVSAVLNLRLADILAVIGLYYTGKWLAHRRG